MTWKKLDDFEIPTQSLQIVAMPDLEPNSKSWQLKERSRYEPLNLSSRTYEHSYAFRWGSAKATKSSIGGTGHIKEDKAVLKVNDDFKCSPRINKLLSTLYSIPNLQGIPIYQKIRSQSKPRIDTVELRARLKQQDEWTSPKDFRLCKTLEEVWQSGSELDQLFGEPAR